MKVKKLFSLLMAMCMLISIFSGCVTINSSDGIGNKSELKVGNLLSGYGNQWLYSLKYEFEKMYANYEFEDGKKGVVVTIDDRDSEFHEAPLLASMDRYGDDVYYVNDIYNQQAFINAGLVYNTTEWIKEKIYDVNGDLASVSKLPATTSILDTMYDGWAPHFNFGTETNEAYYGLPWRIAFGGIVYDADLFGTRGLYLDEFNQFGAKTNDTKSLGPDGKPNTSDDGMPATWTEFKMLMNEMKSLGVIPFVWSGSLTYQRGIAFQQIVANYEGYNDYMLNYNFSGSDSEFGPISDSNAYLLRGQQGKKAALQAFKDIVSNVSYYHSSSFGSSSHKEAEKIYIESTTGSNPIAMLMEGGWWEQESREYADTLADFRPDLAYGKRNFKLLPIPSFVGVDGIVDQTNTERVLFGRGAHSMELVYAGSEKLEMVRKWLEYVHSRDGLSIFTRDTSSFRPFNFTATPERYGEFTSFTKSIYTYIEEGAKRAYDLNISKVRRDNATKFANFMTEFVGTDGITYFEPASAFRADSSWTTDSVFNAYKNSVFTESSWGYTD